MDSRMLTPNELVELTGAKRPARQIAVLSASGIRFVRRIDGRPAVTWAAVEAALAPAPTVADEPRLRLDWMHG